VRRGVIYDCFVKLTTYISLGFCLIDLLELLRGDYRVLWKRTFVAGFYKPNALPVAEPTVVKH